MLKVIYLHESVVSLDVPNMESKLRKSKRTMNNISNIQIQKLQNKLKQFQNVIGQKLEE